MFVSLLIGLMGACSGWPEVKTSDVEFTPVVISPLELMHDTVGLGDEVEVKFSSRLYLELI